MSRSEAITGWNPNFKLNFKKNLPYESTSLRKNLFTREKTNKFFFFFFFPRRVFQFIFIVYFHACGDSLSRIFLS